MKLKGNERFNPAAAYRAKGHRFAAFIAAKVILLAALMFLSVLTLVAPLVEEGAFAIIYRWAMFALQVMAMITPYLAFEALYWWYRMRAERRQVSGT